jgi:hypothetical protein
VELVLEDNCPIHILAKSGTGNIAIEEDGPIGRLVGPLVKEVGYSGLTVSVAFGGISNGRSRRGSTSRGCGRGDGGLLKR